MIFNLKLFLSIQIVVAISYIAFNLIGYEKKRYLNFTSKLHFVIMNFAVFIICIHINSEYQLFCIPVDWVKAILLFFCFSFLVLPFITSKTIQIILAPLVSLGLFISLYTIIFGELAYPLLILLNLPVFFIITVIIRLLNQKFNTSFFDCFKLYQLTILAPFYLLFYIYRMINDLSFEITLLRNSSLYAFILCCLMTFRINFLVQKIEELELKQIPITALVQNHIDAYLVDLILGAHWKYHTEFCPYDGWRPPYQDPVLVFANKVLSPFSMFDNGVSYDRSIELYKETFPKMDTTFNCKCAKNERLFFNQIN